MLSIKSLANEQNLPGLTKLIRPAGFYQSKPKRLITLCNFINQSGGITNLMNQDTLELRKSLLNLSGVGNETADTILLYALDKPQFIIDEYTYRWATNHGIKHTKAYLPLQTYFHTHLKPDPNSYRNFHALIIISQRGREKSMMEVI